MSCNVKGGEILMIIFTLILVYCLMKVNSEASRAEEQRWMEQEFKNED